MVRVYTANSTGRVERLFNAEVGAAMEVLRGGIPGKGAREFREGSLHRRGGTPGFRVVSS